MNIIEIVDPAFQVISHFTLQFGAIIKKKHTPFLKLKKNMVVVVSGGYVYIFTNQKLFKQSDYIFLNAAKTGYFFYISS
jgi:hypothetical protein